MPAPEHDHDSHAGHDHGHPHHTGQGATLIIALVLTLSFAGVEAQHGIHHVTLQPEVLVAHPLVRGTYPVPIPGA